MIALGGRFVSGSPSCFVHGSCGGSFRSLEYIFSSMNLYPVLEPVSSSVRHVEFPSFSVLLTDRIVCLSDFPVFTNSRTPIKSPDSPFFLHSLEFHHVYNQVRVVRSTVEALVPFSSASSLPESCYSMSSTPLVNSLSSSQSKAPSRSTPLVSSILVGVSQWVGITLWVGSSLFLLNSAPLVSLLACVQIAVW